MKPLILFITIVLICTTTFAQNLILNGSFENNSATGNTVNLTSAISTTISNCFEVDGGSLDLITSNNCGTPSNGNWYISCSPVSANWPYLAFSFKLSTILTPGAQYTLTFDKRFCGPNSSSIDIGLTTDSSIMGTAVHTFATPTINSWVNETYVFQAPLAAKYLSVNIGTTGSTGTVGLDNFSLQKGVLGINNNKEMWLHVFPNPASEIISINFDTGSNETAYTICDYTGKIILTGKLNGKTTQILTTGLSRGIYFLKLSGSNVSPVRFILN